MFQDMPRLRQGNAWKPFNELMHRGIFFEVFKKSGNGNPSATENPDTTYALRVAFDIGARGPINHGRIVALWEKKTAISKYATSSNHRRELARWRRWLTVQNHRPCAAHSRMVRCIAGLGVTACTRIGP